MSRYLQAQCGWRLALLPARVAQQTLVRCGWPAVAVSQGREHGEALGAELEQAIQQRLTTTQQAGALPAAQQTPARQVSSEERLYAAPDGVMDCTTERDPATSHLRWRELQVAAVYEGQPSRLAPAPAGPENALSGHPAPLPARVRVARWVRELDPEGVIAAPDQAQQVTYVAETGPWVQFGSRLWLELWERGLGRARAELVVVADGSDHLDQVVNRERRLPGIPLTRILDLAHAQQHLWAVSHAAFGEGRAAAKQWVQARLTALERGQVSAVLDAVERLAHGWEAQVPSVAEEARKALAYFVQRREQVDYPGFGAAGMQIGSGLAASACKRLGTDRMKGAGMRWTVQGAQCVATLRTFVGSRAVDRGHGSLPPSRLNIRRGKCVHTHLTQGY